jgi:hypothetical protein
MERLETLADQVIEGAVGGEPALRAGLPPEIDDRVDLRRMRVGFNGA